MQRSPSDHLEVWRGDRQAGRFTVTFESVSISGSNLLNDLRSEALVKHGSHAVVGLDASLGYVAHAVRNVPGGKGRAWFIHGEAQNLHSDHTALTRSFPASH